MERAYDRSLGTALIAVGLGLLLFGFVQAYDYTVHPPTGNYNVVTIGGKAGNGSGSGAVNGSFNGRFLEAFTFLGIEYLVGASILKGGWNLITPKAETIAVRVKPRALQVEPVGVSAPAPAPMSTPTAAAGATATPAGH
ncbi:MAG TPA: hypothetical protein VEH10_01760 [Thermoplasmata archaeon]|nr:hypothetical protein [Thermoplasmata archaeon]